MITSPAFRGKRYAVLGLARSGLATVEALIASGAEVTAWDEREGARVALESSLSRSDGEGDRPQDGGGANSASSPSDMLRMVPLPTSPARREDKVTFADPLEIDLAGYDGVIVSPGVPLNTHPVAAKARAAGVPLIGDIELFALARPSLPPHKVVGITGTNGKSTTTALIHHILKTAGVPTEMGGNIGLPILAQDPLPEGGVYVLELSSYQIDLTFSLDCDVALLTNLTPDHLDRYDGFEAYAASKLRLFEMQSPAHLGVTKSEDSFEGRLVADLPRGPGSWCLIPYDFDFGADVDQAQWPALQGPHNALNAVMAHAAAFELGLKIEPGLPGLRSLAIYEAMKSFRGLPHRMEPVADRNGILFINDSKATNPDSAAPALAAFPRVHWILGGRAKTDNLGPCAEHLDHVRAAYTIGEAGPMLARLLAGRVPVTESWFLPEAVKEAARAAAPGEVVLLSPACASFDQYRDYEERGDAFRAAVEALA
jgi:UDP-N-acetylmuramoylalanine--D-glutamate ligase